MKPTKAFTDACDEAQANGFDSCGICQNYPIRMSILDSGERVYFGKCDYGLSDSVYLDVETKDIVERWEKFATKCNKFEGY